MHFGQCRGDAQGRKAADTHHAETHTLFFCLRAPAVYLARSQCPNGNGWLITHIFSHSLLLYSCMREVMQNCALAIGQEEC